MERQFNSSLYERLVLSRDKKKVNDLSEKGHVLATAQDVIKEPYVLEFLGIKEESAYSESDLESAIINRIEHFMLELGKGFLFAGRQVRFSFDEEHYYVDLVFYNRYVKSADENKTIGIILCKDKHKALVEITLPEDNVQIFAQKYQLYLPSKEELKRQLEE